MLCHLLGRAIVLVRDDQLSLAIGRRGQNVRLASKLVGWDIEIMTAEELDEVIDKAVKAFEKIDGVETELAERLVEQGILSYDDLSVMEIADLVNTIEGLSEEQATEIVARAEILAEEQSEELPRRKGGRAAAALLEAPRATTRQARAATTIPQQRRHGRSSSRRKTGRARTIPPIISRPTPRPTHQPSPVTRPAFTVRPCLPNRTMWSGTNYLRTKAPIRRETRRATTRSTTWPWR